MNTIISEELGSVDYKWRLGKDQQHIDMITMAHNDKLSNSFYISLVQAFRAMFLPDGFPHSVSEDYATYQKFDTLQALCSSVTGTLSTRAILHGVGVGESAATLLGGTLQWIIRDGSGMIGRIGFASVVASDLDHDAKRWRFAADVTNDIGLMLEIFSSHLPKSLFLPVVCTANLFKAVTGVAGGASRASMTQHFALRGNTADVAAKDGSQETAVNLIGMFLGMAAATFVPETFAATVVVFLFFTILHLLSNYLGVKNLILHHLNEERLLIILQHISSNKKLPKPVDVRKEEGIIFHRKREVHITMGMSLKQAIEKSGADAKSTMVAAMSNLSKQRFAAIQLAGKQKFGVVFAKGVSPEETLEAYVTTVWEHHPLGRSMSKPFDGNFEKFSTALKSQGWKLDRIQLRIHDWRVNMKTE